MPELYADVVGQESAVAELRAATRSPVHAYLLVGPAGVGKRALARSFAAGLVCPDGGCGECRHCLLALGGRHPDVIVFERTGASITVDQAREVTRLASRTPLEARRRVLILADFHLVERAAPALLKTIEEPPPTTVFVLLADRLAPELVTIASRCVTIEVVPLSPARMASVLEAEGADAGTAKRVARVAGGRLDRARLLASDPGLAGRQEAWAGVPGRLDGTGAAVAILVGELLAGAEGIAEPLRARQEAELNRLADEAAGRGERGVPARAAVEARHRREQRRLRVDELRAGLAALAGAYASRPDPVVVAPSRPEVPWRTSPSSSQARLDAVGAIDQAGRDLDRNPNEALLLQALLLRLSSLGS
ncbi:MAG: ATP-binding protein [Acidimicrobiales bacterium]